VTTEEDDHAELSDRQRHRGKVRMTGLPKADMGAPSVTREVTTIR
jgi:hypothetical protein